MRSLVVNLLFILLLSSSPAFAEAAKENNPLSDNTTGAPADNSTETQDNNEQSFKFFPIPFAFGYIIDLAEDTSVKKPWWVRLKVGFQYDDNVLMTSKEAPLPPDITKKDDWRLIANLNGKYMFYKTQRLETVATYSLFQSLHNDLDDFNVTQNMAELWGKYGILPSVDLKVTYTFHHMLLGGDTFDHASMISPRLIVRESEALATHIDYVFRDTDYKDLSTYAYNSERTGDNQLVGITQYIVMSTPAMLRIGYSHDEEKTRRDYLDSTGDKAFIGLSYMPSESFLLDIYWEYNKRSYEDVSPYTSVKRKDTASVMTFTVTQNITDKYGLNLRVFYMQNDSNLAQFDVTRFVPSLMLEMKY
jgi:hypothetical protein